MHPFNRTVRSFFGLAVVIASLGSNATWAQEMDLDGMHGLSTVQRFRLPAPTLDVTYTLLVRVPESLAAETREVEPLPVLYLLDGGVTFPMLAGYYRYLALAEELPDLIVVGISYGTDDFGEGNRRSRDFTAPSSEREHWGGIDRFLDFLATEAFPLVESRLPADPRRRILLGQSLGGQAVLWAALRRPELFWGHIASNPALHRNLDLFLQAPGVKPGTDVTDRPMPRLFVASGSDDDPRFRQPALQWMDHWRDREHPWTLEMRTLQGHGHFSALPASFRDGMRWLFATP